MLPRVTPEQAADVRRLLQQGWAHRQVARRLKISPTTIFRIAHGLWRPDDQSEDPDWELRLRATRCGGCGGLVYQWPCLACELRAPKKAA